MTKYNEQFKLSVVQSYEKGEQGYKAIAQHYGIDSKMVSNWVALYRQHGILGLRKKSSYYTAEFKLAVLRHMQQEALSATQTMVLFNIRG